MNENDSMSNNDESDILDQVAPATDKILIESVWICPYEEPAKPQIKKPPDPPTAAPTEAESPVTDSSTDAEVHHVSLQYKLYLQLQAQQLHRLGLHEHKQFTPVDGLMEGNDWTYNEKDGSWFVPQHDLEYVDHQDSATYNQNLKWTTLKSTNARNL